MSTHPQNERQKTSILPVQPAGESAAEVGRLHEPRGAVAHALPESSTAQRFVQGAWRRRYLILVPILLMLPVSVIAAKLLPVPYVATALLLLQEPGVEDATGTAFAVSDRIEERVAGLEALLKSNRVLSKVLADFQKAGFAPEDPERAIKDLQDRLTLKLIGLDVLEIKLKGMEPGGLGYQLESVVSRFLEALITDRSAMTAGQLLAQNLRKEWQAAQQDYTAANAKLSQILPGGLESASAQLGSLDAGLGGRRSQLAAADGELNRLKQFEEPKSLREVETRRSRLSGEIAQLETQGRQVRSLVDEYRRLEAQKPRLEAEVAATQARYAALAEQFDSSAADYPQRLLNAPERMRIIDLPGDPTAPETSPALYVVFGVAAGILLGIGLGWGAEQADTSLRDRREFSAVAGVPVAALLPKFTAAHDTSV